MAMILGDTGDGKSFSIRGLNPKTTFVFSAFKDSFGWKGWKRQYIKRTANNPGNLLITSNVPTLISVLKQIDQGSRYKTVVIDDFQFFTGFKQIDDGKRKGFEKFNEIAENYLLMFRTVQKLRDDLTVFFMTHTEMDDYGVIRASIGGKWIKEVSKELESYFNVVVRSQLNTDVSQSDPMYGVFNVHKGAEDTVKTPYEMFEENQIPNNLETLRKAMIEYGQAE